MGTRRRRLGRASLIAWIGMAAIVAVIARAQAVYAHGEAADKPFLKDLTLAFYDVHISPTVVKVGEPVTITGKVKVLETWPFTLSPPEVAYFNAIVPGPVFALRDRTINGMEAPGSVVIERGNTYEFKMVILGRMPGRWHVHPGVAVQDTGTLLGPGTWVTVEDSGKPFVYPVTLYNGKTVDLETLGMGGVWWWAFAAFLLGMVWMVYWTVPKRTVTRLAVTSQLNTPDIGKDFGLITDADYRWSRLIVLIALGLLVVGWIYIEAEYPVRIPQQTDRFNPGTIVPGEEEISKNVTVKPLKAVYDDASDTLTLNVAVTNHGSQPLTVSKYVLAMMSFVNGGKDELAQAGPEDFVAPLQVTPNATIAPGQTQEITMVMRSEMLDSERLIPIGDPQQLIAGLLFLKDPSGNTYPVTVRSVVEQKNFHLASTE